MAAAASDHPGRVGLSLSPWNTGDHRAYPVPDMESVDVPAVRLDDIIPAELQLDVVKTDMSYEVRVLGASDGSPAPTPPEVVDAALRCHGEFCTVVLRPT